MLLSLPVPPSGRSTVLHASSFLPLISPFPWGPRHCLWDFQTCFISRVFLSNEILPTTPGNYQTSIVRLEITRCKSVLKFCLLFQGSFSYSLHFHNFLNQPGNFYQKPKSVGMFLSLLGGIASTLNINLKLSF